MLAETSEDKSALSRAKKSKPQKGNAPKPPLKIHLNFKLNLETKTKKMEICLMVWWD